MLPWAFYLSIIGPRPHFHVRMIYYDSGDITVERDIMSDRLLFYIKHAFRSLQRERRRSLFAAFAIAAGVAAIVGLQSLSLSIEDSVTRDIQATHQADVVVSSHDDPFSPRVRARLDDLAFQGRFVEWTYFYVANPDRPSFISSSKGLESEPLKWLQPYLVEPDKYPLYGEVRSVNPDDYPLSQLLTSPGDIVLSQDVAGRLGVGVGDEVVLENAETFTVKGTVSNETSGGVFAPYFVPSMPWFGYLDLHDPRARDAFNVEEGDAHVLFIKTQNEDDTEDVAGRIPISPEYDVETAAEALVDLEDATHGIGKVIMVVGLVSLAIGGIGILTTMLVVVGRRTTEIGVLKALGLKGRQVTFLFMVEGVMLGVVGSIVGILLGVLVSYGLIGFSERFLQTDVDWKLYLQPIYTGLVVGVIATTVFGFLPTLAASRVRPNVVIQPQASALPRARRVISGIGAFFLTAVVVLFLTAVMGLVATVFLDSLIVGLLGAYGALAVLTVLMVVLLAVVWVVGRLPSFGSINLKMSLRGLSRQKGRAASTLLALVVGIFAMSSIVILGDSMKQLIDEFMEDEAGGNVFVFVPGADPEIGDRVTKEISSLEGVTKYVEIREFKVDSVSVNGRPISQDQQQELLDWRDLILITRGGAPTTGTLELADGRHLGPGDVGKPVVVVGPAQPWLHVGDELTFRIGGQQAILQIVGITLDSVPLEEEFFTEGGNFVAPLGALDLAITPDSVGFPLTVPESEASAIAAQLNRNVPGAIAIETETISSVFKEILDRVAVFPLMLSGLALFAGAVIIANSVALSTMERRREIAMMKAVGARGSRVLTALLMENGILGLAGGAIGVALSLIILVIFHRLEPDIPVAMNPFSIIVVLAVAVGVALGAAVLSAWPASKEKPLTVLRYE